MTEKLTISALRTILITDFQIQNPLHQSTQADLLEWLAEAHARSEGNVRQKIGRWFKRYGCSPERIGHRWHELPDFTHRRWEDMRVFHLGERGRRMDIGEKMRFFDESVARVFARFYPESAQAPCAILHVTCTGYRSPSGAQQLVSRRRWGRSAEVYHVYHMGCYAAHPAIRLGMGLISSGGLPFPIDVVHTELCSLHLDPGNHHPEQLVVQSLFSDGFIKYSLMPASQGVGSSSEPSESLEILHMREEIIPDSTSAMNWSTGPLIYEMTLSKEVPILLARALPAFVRSLFKDAGLDYEREKTGSVFAIHPGGPRIIDASEQILDLEPWQVETSREILYERGNMSSATLPHIWQRIVRSPKVPRGALVISLGAGPGLTLVGGVFRKI
jgi:predicted naringenin-chalcone synthase